MALKLNIIGCGRLGTTLAFLFKKAGVAFIQDIINLNAASAAKAVAIIGQGTVCHTIKQLNAADIYLIATPDDCIERVCQQLAEQAPLVAGNIVFHCSGLLSSDSLDSVAQHGCYTASVHPVFSFSDPTMALKTFKGTYCLLEGNKQALAQLLLLIEAIGGQLFFMDKENKPLYHVASVFAANYLVTLSTIAETCYRKAGLADKLAKTLTRVLMAQVVNAIQKIEESKQALSGPIQRGDSGTIKKHLKTLAPFPNLKQVYKSLGKVTLPLTKHSDDLKKTIDQLFLIGRD